MAESEPALTVAICTRNRRDSLLRALASLAGQETSAAWDVLVVENASEITVTLQDNTALKAKVLSVGGIGKLPDLLGALGDNVITDLGIADANALYDLVKNVDQKNIVHVSVDDGNFLYECGYPRNCTAASCHGARSP